MSETLLSDYSESKTCAVTEDGAKDSFPRTKWEEKSANGVTGVS